MNGDNKSAAALDEAIARVVADALRRVRYGTVTLTIHDGRVTEIDTTERTRLPPTK